MTRGSSCKVDKLREKRNRPPDGEPWVWLTRELLESDAWRTAPINTRRVVERVALEHMAHAGRMNGELIVTYTDFQKWGIRSPSISAAIQDAILRGLIDRTQKGRASHGLDRWPSKYAVGWYPRRDAAAALNRWKNYKLQKSDKNNFSPAYGSEGGEAQKTTISRPRNRQSVRPTEPKAAMPVNCCNSPPSEPKVLSIFRERGGDGTLTHPKNEGDDGWPELPAFLDRRGKGNACL